VGTKPGSGYCQWTTYAYQANLGLYCGPMSLWNIQKNMGYNYFQSYTSLASDIQSVCGSTVGPTMNFSHMTQYLTNRGYQYNSSTTGYMSVSAIHTMTYTNHKYGLAFSNATSSTGGHITAIIGYSATTTKDYAILFDPHKASPCKITLDLSIRLFTSSGTQYKWDNGYISNITHN
jgi:hypothetical protein